MKKDLLQECNDQRIPPKDFMQTFCVRCRNADCVNAGWADSLFDGRVATQVERLITNPTRARAEDSRFDPIRALRFLEVPAAIALRRGADPWAGPEVHLAEPDSQVSSSVAVEAAVAKLAESKGRLPTVVAVESEPALPSSVTVPSPPDPPAPTPPRPPPVAVNTEFPEEGVMLGGGPPPTAPSPAVDPWAPKPKVHVVPPGAKVRMGS